MDEDQPSGKKIKSRKGDRRTVAKEIIELLQQAASQRHEILSKKLLRRSSTEYHINDRPANTYDEQLQKDFGNVVIGAGRIYQESTAAGRPAECDSPKVKASSNKLFEHLKPTDKDAAKKAKKHKHRSRGEKSSTVSFWTSLFGNCKEDMKLLAAFLHRIKFFVLWPFVLVATLIVNLSTACLSALGRVFNAMRSKLTGFNKREVQRNFNNQEAFLQNTQEPKIIEKALLGPPNSADKNEQPAELLTGINYPASVKQRLGDQNRAISKDNQTPKKKFSPSLKMLDELRTDDHPYSRQQESSRRQCHGGKNSSREKWNFSPQDDLSACRSENGPNGGMRMKKSSVGKSGVVNDNGEIARGARLEVYSELGNDFLNVRNCQQPAMESDNALDEDGACALTDSEKSPFTAASSIHLRKRRYNRQSRDGVSRFSAASSSEEDVFESRRLRSHSGAAERKNQRAEQNFWFLENSSGCGKQTSLLNVSPLHRETELSDSRQAECALRTMEISEDKFRVNCEKTQLQSGYRKQTFVPNVPPLCPDDSGTEEYSRRDCNTEFSDFQAKSALRTTKNSENKFEVDGEKVEWSQKVTENEVRRELDETPLQDQWKTSKVTDSPGKKSIQPTKNEMSTFSRPNEDISMIDRTPLSCNSYNQIALDTCDPEAADCLAKKHAIELNDIVKEMRNQQLSVNAAKNEVTEMKHSQQYERTGMHSSKIINSDKIHPSLMQIAERLQRQQKEVAQQAQLLIQQQAKFIQQRMHKYSTETTELIDPTFCIKNSTVEPKTENIKAESSEKIQIPVKDQGAQPATGETMQKGSGETCQKNQSSNFDKKEESLDQRENPQGENEHEQKTAALPRPGHSQTMRGEQDERKPVDAKAKWLEIKRKLYGADYGKPEELEKQESKADLEPACGSKPPAHKIFQYNMRMGRARQMGAEPSAFEGVCEEDSSAKTGRPAGNSLGLAMIAVMRARSNAPTTPAEHRLPQTQSLLDWPSETEDGAFVRQRKQLPVPKPRREGRKEGRKIRDVGPKTIAAGCGEFDSHPAGFSTSDSHVQADRRAFLASSCNSNHESGLCSRGGQESLIQLSDGAEEEIDGRNKTFQDIEEDEIKTGNCPAPEIVQHPTADHTAPFLPHSGINLQPDDQILLHGPGGQPARVQSAMEFFRANISEMHQKLEGSGPWVALGAPSPSSSTQKHPHVVNTYNCDNRVDSFIHTAYN